MENPSTVGRYEIAERVGRGGMGVLYRGRDPVLDREVAIKVMTADLSDDIDARTSFFREAKAAARLQHRNIVTIFDFGESDGNPYIAMEFLRGQNLAARLRSDPPLTVDAIADIIVQLCTGLHHAHSSGVIHRDVKPANVWILPDGAVKLLDFGIARISSSTMTHGKETLGSVAYMAPERFGSGPVDSRADIFAVGVILYELLAGRRPFEGDAPTVIVTKILQQDPPALYAVAPLVPPALVAVVDRALQKDPEARYQTALDMATDVRLAGLENHVAAGSLGVPELMLADPQEPGPEPNEPQPADVASESPPVSFDQHPRARTRGWVLGAVALLAVVVVGGLWLSAGKRAEREAAPATPTTTPATSAVGPQTELPKANGASAALPSTTMVTLRVESKPPGATVSLNGTQLPKTTPTEVPVERGKAGRIRVSRAGFASIDVPVTAELLAAGRVGVELTATTTDPVILVADGPYDFEIVEGTRVISDAKKHHEVRIVGRKDVRLQARQYLLNQLVAIDPAKSRHVTIAAPGLGLLRLDFIGAFEECKARIGTKDLGGMGDPPQTLVAGAYTVTVVCPNGPGGQYSVLIRAGETAQQIIK